MDPAAAPVVGVTVQAPRVPDAGPRGRTRQVALVAAAVVGVVVTLVVLKLNGQLAAVTAGLLDAGPVTRWGLPALRTLHDLAAATTVGLLVLAAWCVGPGPGKRKQGLGGPRRPMVRAATTAASVWAGSALAVLVLTAADVSGLSPAAPGFSTVLASFAFQVDLGRALLASLLLVGLAAVLSAVATRIVAVAWAAVAALLALLPLALAGHAAGNNDHMNSVDSLALHLVAVCVWVGGLAALVLTGHLLGGQRSVVVARYSTLAGVCFAVVAASGVVNAALRLGSFAALASGYGVLVIGKVVALGLLGLAGYAHRRRTIPRLEAQPRLFARVAAVELVVMGATLGLAVALSRSAPPVPAVDTSDPVGALLGYPVPAPFTVARYFGAFYPNVLWLAIALAMVVLYALGVTRLVRRGDRWPLSRLILWVLGCALLVFVTSGGPALYGRLSFSLHMVQHMALMVAVPFPLVFGAPVTLAMRALRARRDGSFGPREVLLALVHSRVLRVLGHPVVAALLFTGSLTVFYYTRLFPLAMFTHTGHVLMTAHFLLSGYLFIWALVGIDPGPDRPPYAFRLVLLLMTLGFHAFFGIALMSSQQLLAQDWWGALGQHDLPALLADQQRGGAIAWGAGDIPSLLLGVALLVGWVRSDHAESKRLDRRADRDGDAELRAYNAALTAMAERETPRR